jgi:uroporphyrin-III C-methyltransferase
LETFIVPGISSSMAVPAYQGIPLTKRGASESFWVITGTTKNHQLSTDVALAAKSTATVVILMGMSKLSEIVRIFSQENKQNTSVAIIQNGTRAKENVGIGTIKTIEKIVKEKQLANPAIIIIGEVVKERAVLTSIYSEVARN